MYASSPLCTGGQFPVGQVCKAGITGRRARNDSWQGSMFRQDQMFGQESYRILKEGFVAGG